VKNPVSIGEDSTRDIPNEVKERCRNEDNMQHVNPATTKVKKLATKLSDDCIYLVIEVPDRKYHTLLKVWSVLPC